MHNFSDGFYLSLPKGALLMYRKHLAAKLVSGTPRMILRMRLLFVSDGERRSRHRSQNAYPCPHIIWLTDMTHRYYILVGRRHVTCGIHIHFAWTKTRNCHTSASRTSPDIIPIPLDTENQITIIVNTVETAFGNLNLIVSFLTSSIQ